MNFDQSNDNFIKQINKTFSKYKLQTPLLTNDCINVNGKFKLTLPQQFISDYYTPNNPNGLLLYHSIGSGKCHGINTPIMMFDGTTKIVQDIVIGDKVMGDDSTPRNVLSLARGEDEMYKVIPVKGNPYIVNKEHILCLKMISYPRIQHNKSQNSYNIAWLENNSFKWKTLTYTNIGKEKGLENAKNFMNSISQNNILEISVKDYLKLAQHNKNGLKGYRVPLNFEEKQLILDPYFLGFWLGDSTSSSSDITTQDSVIINYLRQLAPNYECYLDYKEGYTYSLKGIKKSNNIIQTSPIKKLFKQINVLDNKHIPLIYKTSSREQRLKLLAGLLDSDGSMQKNGYDFIQKNEKLLDDVIFLCRSLGFSCYKNKEKKGCWYLGKYKENYYYRININGKGIEDIPVKCERKKCKPRQQIKDVLVTGIKLEHIERDNYYGFTLDGNNRYLMADFTVCHNSLTAVNLIKHFISYNANIIWVTRTTLKKDLDKALTLLPLSKPLTRFSYKQFSNIGKRKGENYRKLMEKAHKLNPNTDDPLYRTLVIIDEAHKLYTKDLKIQELHDINAIQTMIYNSYKNSDINRTRIVLMSATPITENPEEILHLFNLIISNPKNRIDISSLKNNYINSDGTFTKKGSLLLSEKIKGLVSYLNTSKDPSKFAQVRYNQVLVPISEKPDVPITEDYCNKHYRICIDNQNDKKDCLSNLSKCKVLVKNNKKILAKNKYQIDLLKTNCSIIF